MEIEKRKQAIKQWIKDGYKFARDKQGRAVMFLDKSKPIQISDQNYYFAQRVLASA